MKALLQQALRIAAVAGFVLNAGCAVDPPAAPDNYLSSSFARQQPSQLILLVHVPAVDSLARRGDPLAAEEVNKQLVSAGFRVASIPNEDFQKLLDKELTDGTTPSGRISRQDHEKASLRALQQLAQIGAAEAGSVMVVRTRLVVRPTTNGQNHASWDGQRRPILFSGRGPMPMEIEGTGPGVSLEVLGVRSNGTLAIRSFGGISLPYRSDARTAQPSDRTDLFDHTAELMQGTAIALAPFLRARP